MLILNIVLLVLSVAIMALGLILTWKPNPMYSYNETTQKAEKSFYFGSITLLFAIPSVSYYVMSILIVDHLQKLIAYFISFFLIIILSLASYFKQRKQKPEFEKKSKFKYANIFYIVCGIIIGIFSKILAVVIIMFLLGTIDMIYQTVTQLKKNKLFSIYLPFSFWFLFIVICLFAHARFQNIIPAYIIYIQTFSIILSQLSFTLYVFDIKKLSPIYEKQYIEENKPKEVDSAENNLGNGVKFL